MDHGARGRGALNALRVPRVVLSGRVGLVRVGAMVLAALGLAGATATAASANAPNPTSVVVDSVVASGAGMTVTVSGTWTWNVPNGAQQDCNDSRIGVGYAVSWGDNAANPLHSHGSEPVISVGSSSDDWVHSVTQGNETVEGPYKMAGGHGATKGALVQESMLGETPEAMLFGFGSQGISSGASSSVPTNEDAAHWFSNCGPTQQSQVNGQLVGNSDPSEPEKGFPNGTWGPISHTYAKAGEYRICPVLYDPHGNHVGEAAQNAKEITAGGSNYNDDNSVESNGNTSECAVAVTVPPPKPGASFTIVKEQKIGSGSYTTGRLSAHVGDTVDYLITVTDSGEAPESFGPLVDPNCTNIHGGPTGPLVHGQSASWTCEHTLTSAGEWPNVAVVSANGEPKESNRVVAVVPSGEVIGCMESAHAIRLQGGGGPKRKAFTVRYPSAGVKRIIFELDGRTIAKFSSAQAKHGYFRVRIDPAKLRFGAHRVTVKTFTANPACPGLARTAVFVHPKPRVARLKFTG